MGNDETGQIPQNAVKVIHDASGYRRVVIYRHSNGTFGFEEWKFLTEENSWAPLRKKSETFVNTVEQALREATGRIPWMSDAFTNL